MTTESGKRFCRHFYGKVLKDCHQDIEIKDKDSFMKPSYQNLTLQPSGSSSRCVVDQRQEQESPPQLDFLPTS